MFTSKRSRIFCAFSIVAMLFGGGFGIMQFVQLNHIFANVPLIGFDEKLNADLKEYFSRRLDRRDLKVEVKLLRNGATQSGVSFPKYYAWVTIRNIGGQLVTSGAARLAAIESERFEVTDFFNVEEIRNSPISVRYTFPAALVPKIQELAEAK